MQLNHLTFCPSFTVILSAEVCSIFLHKYTVKLVLTEPLVCKDPFFMYMYMPVS